MKKRIAFYIASLVQGGAERVIINLAEYFAGQGYEVYMLNDFVSRQDKPIEEYPLDPKVKRIWVGYEPTGRRGGDMLRRIGKVRKAYKEIRPDIVVSFIGKANIRAILAALGTKIPVVVSVRSTPQREYGTRSMKLCAGLLFPHAAGIVFQTVGARDFFKPAVRKRSVILPNSIRKQFMKPRYEGKRENEIVTVGRLERVKNQELLIRAFARIAGEYPDTLLKIYGDGSRLEALKRCAAQEGVGDRVSFMGSHDNVDELIYRAGIFALSSDAEGMPNVLLEAMAMGVPCISTDCPCGGPGTLIKDGENGLLVPVGDARAMAEAFQKLLGDRRLAEKLSVNAAGLQEELNTDKVNAMWKDFLESRMRPRKTGRLRRREKA